MSTEMSIFLDNYCGKFRWLQIFSSTINDPHNYIIYLLWEYVSGIQEIAAGKNAKVTILWPIRKTL